MTVGTNTTKEEVDTTELLYFFLVGSTLGCKVGSISIKNMDILLRTVDVVEQVGEHERMVAFGMLYRQVYILIHVKGDHILEGHLSFLVSFHQSPIHSDRRRAGRQSEHKGFFCRWFCSIDTFNNMIGCPLGHQIIIRFNNNSHNSVFV